MSLKLSLNKQYHFLILPTQLIFLNGALLHQQIEQGKSLRSYNYKLSVQKGFQVYSESKPPIQILPGSKQLSANFQPNQNMYFYIPMYNPYRQIDFIVKLKSDCWGNQYEFQDIGQFSFNSNTYIEKFKLTENKMFQQRVKITKTVKQKQFQFQIKYQLFIDCSKENVYKSAQQFYPNLISQSSIKERSNIQQKSKISQSFLESTIQNKDRKNISYIQKDNPIQINKGLLTYKSKLAQSIRQKYNKKSEIIPSNYSQRDYGYKSSILSPNSSQKSFKFTSYQKQSSNEKDNTLKLSKTSSRQKLYRSQIRDKNQNQINQIDSLPIQQKQKPILQQEKDQSNNRIKSTSQIVLDESSISHNPQKQQTDNSLNKKNISSLQSTAPQEENDNIFEIDVSPFQTFMKKQFETSQIERILQQSDQQISNKQQKDKKVQMMAKQQKKKQQQVKHGFISLVMILLIGIMTYLYFFSDTSVTQKKNHYYYKPKLDKRKIY